MAKIGVDCTLTLPRSMVSRLDRLAKMHATSRSEVARDLLGAALDEAGDLLKVLGNEKVRAALLDAFLKPGVMRAMAQALGEELRPGDAQKLLDFLGGGRRGR